MFRQWLENPNAAGSRQPFRIVTLLAILLLAACNNSPPPPVKIGVVLPLRGDYSIYGQAGLRGVQLAVDEVNRQGGVLDGRHLELIVRDNKLKPDIAVKNAK